MSKPAKSTELIISTLNASGAARSRCGSVTATPTTVTLATGKLAQTSLLTVQDPPSALLKSTILKMDQSTPSAVVSVEVMFTKTPIRIFELKP